MAGDENNVIIAGIKARFIEPDIIRYEVPKDMRITLPILEELSAYANSLLPNQKRKVLGVFNSNFIPSVEANDFMVDPERVNRISAEAFCINSVGLKFMANFYLKIKKPAVNTCFFDDEARALTWLRKQETGMLFRNK